MAAHCLFERNSKYKQHDMQYKLSEDVNEYENVKIIANKLVLRSFAEIITHKHTHIYKVCMHALHVYNNPPTL